MTTHEITSMAVTLSSQVTHATKNSEKYNGLLLRKEHDVDPAPDEGGQGLVQEVHLPHQDVGGLSSLRDLLHEVQIRLKLIKKYLFSYMMLCIHIILKDAN